MDYNLVCLWAWSILVVSFLLYKIKLLEDKLLQFKRSANKFDQDSSDAINDIFTILVEMDKKKSKGVKHAKR